jgi:hypothetical protein
MGANLGLYTDCSNWGFPGYTESLRENSGLLPSLNRNRSVQTGSGAHPAFYSMGTGGLFPRA